MTRTNHQVQKTILRFFNQYRDREEYYSALLRYWIKYDLTEYQCELLNNAKSFK